MSVDPIMFKRNRLENPQRLNLYNYAVNNPLRFLDPDGRDPMDYVKGFAQGLNNFVNHAYSALTAAAKDPFTPLHGMVNAVSTAVTAYGTAEGRKTLTTQFKALSTQEKTAVVTEALVAGAIAGAAKGQSNAAASTATDTTTVTHFTNNAAVDAISTSGQVNAGSFVTLPSEIPAGATSGQVESLLEIGPGKGRTL